MARKSGAIFDLTPLTKMANRVLGRFGYVKAASFARLLSDSWQRGYGISPPSTTDDYLDQYGASAWVYRCVNVISKRRASARFILFTEDDEGNREEIRKHVLLDVLRKPNDMLTGLQLWMLTSQQMELCGEAFWYTAPNTVGGPAEILPLMPDKVTVIPGTDRLIQGYIYEVGSEKVSFDADEVLHFSYPNPDPENFFRGAGPIQAMQYEIATNQNAGRYAYKFFRNSAVPAGGYLATESRLESAEVDRLLALWEKHHMGEDKAYKIALAQQGLKYMTVGLKQNEMQFLEQLAATRDTICSCFGVPMSIAAAGDQKFGDRSKSNQDEVNFAVYTVTPGLALVAAEIEAFLLPRFGAELRCEFESVVPRDQELLLKRHAAYLDRDVVTVNEVREELGKDPVPWGDVPLSERRAQLFQPPEGEESEEDQDDDGDDGDDGDEERDDEKRDDDDKRDEEEAWLRPRASPSVRPTSRRQAKPSRGAVSRRQAVAARIAQVFGSKDAREDEWDEYVDRLTARERKYLRPHRKWLQNIQDETNARIRRLLGEQAESARHLTRNNGAVKGESSPVADQLLFNTQDESAKLRVIILPFSTTVILEEAGHVIAQLQLDITVTESTPGVHDWSTLRADKFSFDVTETVAEQLRQVLDAGIRAGETATQLSKRVNELFRDLKGWQAERIARTEAAAASSQARLVAFQESDVIDGKSWLTARDEYVRDNHKIDGQTVKKGELFTLADGVTTPGPGLSGDPANDINCRCEALPYISDQEE